MDYAAPDTGYGADMAQNAPSHNSLRPVVTDKHGGGDGKKIDAVSVMNDTSFILRAFQPGRSLLRSLREL